MAIDEYIKLLGNKCYNVCGQMTQALVSMENIKTIKSSSSHINYKNAIIIPYENQDEKFKGKFVLGFNDNAMAVKLASAISRNVGMPDVDELDDMARDFLFEFMNTVVGEVITGWDELGLTADFSPPEFVEDFNLDDISNKDVSIHAITLGLDTDPITILVYFEESSLNPLEGKKILVVDDSKMIRHLLASEFEKYGCQVSQAENGLDGVKHVQADKPDLIFMDLIMPKMGGLEAIRLIRDIYPEINIIVFTSSSKKQEVVTAASYKVKGYVKKPIQMEKLLKLVNTCFES
ncbi:MAG: response regulator [Desulfobacteraceae bacterium]|nr:response regulator [Desulfobacteraceae bacterium]